MTELSKEILEAEFGHVKGITYLDHAAATLYSSKQLEAHYKDLTSHLYSNPHSGSPSSKLTSALVDSARELVLQHFDTDSEHYDVIFTAGCTAALDLLCHAFPWAEGRSLFCYLDDNHTSVVGMREVARSGGAKTFCMSPTEVRISHCNGLSEPHPPSACNSEPHPPSACNSEPHPPPSCNSTSSLFEPHPLPSSKPRPPPPCHLFAYPAQSNFSGHKYPLSWCRDVPQHGLVASGTSGEGAWFVLLDAASLASTSPLDLSSCSPHFITLSFYKLFGFPTGLGALLVRRDCATMLSKHYYGGGTVKATDSWSPFHVAKDQLHDRFEDGTLPFLDILALRHGFAALTRLGTAMDAIQKHTFGLARLAYTCMSELKHRNGCKVCNVYTDNDYSDASKQGPIVNFNLLGPDGQVLGYSQVEKLASVFDVHLRTGCFCNTGACMRFLDIDSATLQSNLQQGHECGDSVDLINGRPTGSVRVSFGYMSTREDVNKFLGFIKNCFIDEGPKPNLSMPIQDSSTARRADWTAGEVGSTTSRRDQCSEEGTGFCDHKGYSGELGISEGCGVQSTSLISCGDIVHVNSDLPQEATLPLSSLSSSSHPPSPSPSSHPPSPSPSSHPPSPSPHPPSPSSHPPSPSPSSHPPSPSPSLRLHSITLYPIKSCGGFKVQQWLVGPKGLLFDREWMVMSKRGSLVSLKQEPKLCQIQPSLDLKTWSLTLAAEGHDSLVIPALLAPDTPPAHPPLPTRVCGDRVQGVDCGEEAAKWLEQVLGKKCRLIRQNPQQNRQSRVTHHPSGKRPPLLSLANEAQYLVLTQGSLKQLLRAIGPDRAAGLDIETLALRFRANFVVGGGDLEPYAEERWTEIKIGSHCFKVTGKCVRCQVVCVDQDSGGRSLEPLRTLLALRGSKASFGIYLANHFTLS